MGMDGWMTAQVWLFFVCLFIFLGCGWNEQRKVGEKHGGVHGTDTDNMEKPCSSRLKCSKADLCFVENDLLRVDLTK